ncbi:MAG: hypothetical protein J6D57_13010 [Mogibacterium sp.]|nr:hypothetical protein [Mogibacterium sp.]
MATMNSIVSNSEKQNAYRNGYKRLNTALKYEFYLEALSISYAVIEDRLVAFLHHAGIVSRNNPELKINDRVKPYIKKLLGEENNSVIKVKDISVKVRIIKALLSMTEERAEEIDEEIKRGLEMKSLRKAIRPGYFKDLYTYIDNTLDRRYLLSLLDDIDPWRDSRNQLIHALLNKTVKTVQQAQKECAYAGYDFSRDLDDRLVKPFKKGNKLRKKYNIQ